VIGHDYDYAQILTLDLLVKGHRYQDVPITYHYRSRGRSFVRPLYYLRRVIPAIWRQLNPKPTSPPATGIAPGVVSASADRTGGGGTTETTSAADGHTAATTTSRRAGSWPSSAAG
jgi:hypothetical protein